MTFSFLFIRGYITRDVCWFRFPVRGFAIKRTPPLFGERHGYVKSIALPFGWRLTKLLHNTRGEYNE